MTPGEGSGWHRESRRHHDAAMKGRPTHEPRSGTSKKEIHFSKDNPLSEKEINLIMKRINASPRDEHGNVTDPEARALIDRSWDETENDGWRLTREQNEKGLAWLHKHKSQMGGRELGILERDPEIRLIGVHDDHKIINGRHYGHYYPYYRVIARKEKKEPGVYYASLFEYSVIGGKINIMG